MSYIGRGLDKISNIEHLDTITFDGSSSYSLTKSSVAYTPNSAQSILISIDGVVQSNNFTVSGSTIDFGVAVPSTSTCDFIKHFGTGLITTPADGTVSLDKLSASGTPSSSTFLRGDNSWQEASGKFESSLLHITHETADSDNAGGVTANSWNTGTINTIKTNEISSATLSSNVISLPAGNYYIQAEMFLTNCHYVQTRLRDTTNSTTLVIGNNVYTEGYAGASSNCIGRFTLSGTANIEFQYYCTFLYVNTGQGFGLPTSGEVNRFKNVQIWKI